MKAAKPNSLAEDVTFWELSGEENLCHGAETLLSWLRCWP
jgi:hypothetical protein